MTIQTWFDQDGRPIKESVYLNSLACCALYNDDKSFFDDYANRINGKVQAYYYKPDTYIPDYCVIISEGSAFIAFAGTTNIPQWLGHSGGAVCPVADTKIPVGTGSATVNASFLFGLTTIEPMLDNAIESIGAGPVYLTGHSYGAAVAFLYGLTLKSSLPPQSRVELMTFGEPRSMDGRTPKFDVDIHARIISTNQSLDSNYDHIDVDPVTLAPPPIVQLAKFGAITKFFQKYLAFTWAHHGKPWVLHNGVINPGIEHGLEGFIPGIEIADLIANSPGFRLHYSTTYLDFADELVGING